MLGFFFVIFLSFCSWGIANLVPFVSNLVIALLIGAFCRLVYPLPSSYNKGFIFIDKKILPLAITLLGVGLDFSKLQKIPFQFFVSMFLLVFFVILISLFLYKFFRISRTEGILIAIGNTICGSAAIAATGPLLSNNKKQIAVSLGVINLLGTVALFFIPFFMSFSFFNLDQEKAIFIGGSLQSVAHVLAAGYALDPQIAELALAIKSVRVFFLIPIIFLLSFSRSHKKNNKYYAFTSLPFLHMGFFVLCFSQQLKINRFILYCESQRDCKIFTFNRDG